MKLVRKALYFLSLISLLFSLAPSSRIYSATLDTNSSSAREKTLFQWLPSFNFIFRGAPAQDDGHLARTIGSDIRYDSLILSRWHLEQRGVLARSYAAARSSISRNVTTVMLSLIYIKDSRLLMRNVPIPLLFLSGFVKDDSPIKEAEIPLPIKCIGELYSSDPAYPAYLADLIRLFRGSSYEEKYQTDRYMKNDDTSPRTTPSKKFKAEECHSERGIAIYLRNMLLNDTEVRHALLEGIDPRKDSIVGLIVNIASYRDMCGSCQDTFVQELTHGQLFLNALREAWRHRELIDGEFAVVVAQSGMKEYGEGAETTRSTHKGFIHSDGKPIELEEVKNCVIHMENK